MPYPKSLLEGCLFLSMGDIPSGYKTYERILWLDYMLKENWSQRLFGPPTVSNLLAHIVRYKDREIRDFYADDVDFRVLCSDFRRVMIPKYITETQKVATLTSENSMVINRGYYKRDREERVIEPNNTGYRRFSYLRLLDRRSKEVLKEFDISSNYYYSGDIVVPRKGGGEYYPEKASVVRFDDSKKADLPREAQRKLELDDKDVRDYAEWFSDSSEPVYTS